MAKHGKTKMRIIQLIRSGNNNLSTISDELGLAASTVSKHLQDLEETGLIVQKDDTHIKKWKYYEVNEQNLEQKDDRERRQGFFNGRMPMVATAVLLVLVLSGIFYLYGSSLAPKGLGTYVPISITDPPQVPIGTQALYINYSSLRAQVVGQDGSSAWVQINTSGRLDLIGLVNASQMIGGVEVNSTSRVRSVQFSIDSASIMIANVSYPVAVQGKEVVAELNYSGSVNSSLGILLDFSPIVVAVPRGNSSTFVMLHSVRGAMVDGMGQRGSPNMYLGGPRPLPQNYRDIFGMPLANLTAYNITFNSNGSNFSVGLTLENNAAKVIKVMGVVILPKGAGRDMGAQGSDKDQGWMYREENSSVVINSSVIYSSWHKSGNDSLYILLQKPANGIYLNNLNSAYGPVRSGDDFMFGTLNLMLESNGTLTMRPDLGNLQLGYELGPTSSEYFSYKGSLWQQQSGLLNATNYTIEIMTDMGLVRANVTK